MNTPVSDILTRFVFDDRPVRGIHVCLDNVWHHIAENKDYPPAIRTALGELTTAAVLLAGNLKFDGSLMIQVQGKGALKLLVAEATSAQTCRATARWDAAELSDRDTGLRELLGEGGMFVITLQPAEGEAWQGVVEIEGGDIAGMLTAYMARSEQLDTFICLSATEKQAAGLLLQRLPGSDTEADNEAWNSVLMPAQTLTAAELDTLDAHTLLHRLFHESSVRVFPQQHIEFACTCSREKVADMLLLLGKKEADETVAEQGSIEISCDFCGQRYVFEEADVETVFENADTSVAPEQTV